VLRVKSQGRLPRGVTEKWGKAYCWHIFQNVRYFSLLYVTLTMEELGE